MSERRPASDSNPESAEQDPAEDAAEPVRSRASAEPASADAGDGLDVSPAQAATAGEVEEVAAPVEDETVTGQVNQSAGAAADDGGAEAGADLAGQVEAALLTADRALSSTKLAEALDVAIKHIKATIGELNAQYEQAGRSFRIEAVAKGWKVLTLPQYADVLQALHKTQSQQKLSPAAMETLAVIAYKQPILRADLEAIRGVACGEVLRSLMDRHLVKIVGRAEEIGRPMLYGTTKTFLEVFGLSSLNDLPKVEQLSQPTE